MNPPEVERLKKYSFEIGPIRPPSEGGSHSLLIRATRNCPWRLCKFCFAAPYNREKFELRKVEEIKKDIETAKAISEEIKAISKKIGGMDWASLVVDSYFLYNKEPMELDPDESKNFQSIVNVFNWLRSGAHTAFLQDANSLIMRTHELVEVLRYLKKTFPSLERITSYARSKTLAQKTLEELKEIREAGLLRLHVGLESGDDEVLKYVNKGVTSEEHVLAGRKTMEAGFELSLYWMPGLGGKAMSEQHARNTARVLDEINPDFIRSRRFIPLKNTPLLKEWEEGKFQLLSPHEELKEIRLMVENLDVTGRLCFDHSANPFYMTEFGMKWVFKQDYDGYKFPEEKSKVLKIIERGLEVNESDYVHAKDLSGIERL